VTNTVIYVLPKLIWRTRVKAEVQGRLSGRGIRVTITNKNIGYELRCAAPIPFDMAYCRDLGYSAIRFLLNGSSGAMISVQGGRMVPLPFPRSASRRPARLVCAW